MCTDNVMRYILDFMHNHVNAVLAFCCTSVVDNLRRYNSTARNACNFTLISLWVTRFDTLHVLYVKQT
jgi:hypothetical protein